MLPLLVGYFRPLAERWSPIALRRRPRTEFLALSAKTKGSMNLKLDSTVQRTFSGHRLFRNERRPTKFDKKILLWTKRFKKEEDIPPLLSVEVLKAAHNQLRIRICYIMIALTLLGCVAMIISGKQAAKRDDTLLKMNIEKKAKWRMESQKEQELVAGNKE